MQLIQCAEKCKFQIDGYCGLEKCGTVNSNSVGCPYYKPLLSDDGDGLTEIFDTDKL